jgi:hypothetical protein
MESFEEKPNGPMGSIFLFTKPAGNEMLLEQRLPDQQFVVYKPGGKHACSI